MLNSLSKLQEQVRDRRKGKRWWLFHATDFQSLMYPCFIFGRILGTFPYKINDLSFVMSKPCYILSNIVMCVFSFGALITIFIMNKLFDNDRDIIGINIIYITKGFIVLATFILNRPRIHLLQTIIKISSKLPPELYQLSSVLIHTKDIFGCSYVLVHILYGFYKLQFSFLLNVLLLYVTLLVFHIDMMYINCVCVLKICFQKINLDLANLLINNESHLIKWLNHEQKNLLLIKLNALKKQHLMVSDTVQKLNIIFSPHLLATIGLSFISITFELYFNIQWKNELSIKRTLKVGHFYIILDIVHYFTKIALIAWACETGKKQAVKITTTIHEVLNSINDKKIARELQLFSLQTMHCDNTFSAKGLILDATLITKVIGTVTTYLLILIQFLIMAHSCDKTTIINGTQPA